MDNITKIKAFISTILLAGITFTYPPLCAADISPDLQVTQSPTATSSLAEHKQIISQFIDEIRNIQNRTYQLIQVALDNPIKDITNFKRNINTINSDAAELRRNVLNYQTTLIDTSFQYRDVLLLLNALNYTKNTLFELELLSVITSNVERTRIFENLFQSRAEGVNALNILENLISESYD